MSILEQYGFKPITFNNDEQQSNNQINTNLLQGLKQPQALNTIKLNDGTSLLHLGSYQEPLTTVDSVFNKGTYYTNYKQFGFNSPEDMSKHIVNINGQAYLKQDPTFIQKYGTGIQLGLGAANLGLGLASFIQNRATMKKQRAVMSEQLKEAKEEYNRLKQLRQKLSSQY